MISFTAAAAIGAAIGALLAGFLARYNLANGYLVAAACFGLAALAASTLPSHDRARNRGKLSLDPLPRIARALSEPLLPFSILIFMVQGYWALRDFAVPLFILEHGYSAMTVGVVFALTSIGGLAGIFLSRRLLSKNPPPAVITAALLVMGVAAIILPLGPLVLLMVGSLFYGTAEAGLSPAITDESTRGVSLREAPEILASVAAVGALAWIIVPILAGILAESGVPFTLLLLLGGMGVIGSYVYARRRWDFERAVPKLSWKRRRRLF